MLKTLKHFNVLLSYLNNTAYIFYKFYSNTYCIFNTTSYIKLRKITITRNKVAELEMMLSVREN